MTMKFWTKFGFGLGHVLNDLCAAMWFTYTLVFFTSVLRWEAQNAGYVILIGQIADGISTVFVGIMSDRGDDLFLCNRFGNRKAWHIVGTVCTLISFPFIFMECMGCNSTPEKYQLVYFGAFVVIFQFGWAAVQISHMSMINDIASNSLERSELTAIRYGATVVATLFMYGLIAAFLGFNGGPEHSDKDFLMSLAVRKNVTDAPYSCESNGAICPDDKNSFRNVMLICIGVGAICSFIFHILVPNQSSPVSIDEEEPTRDGYVAIPDEQDDHTDSTVRNGTSEEQEQIEEPRCLQPTPMKLLDWFKEPQFYLIAGMYMSTRLFVNQTQTYIPKFVDITLRLASYYIALVPLAMFICGFCMSTIMKYAHKYIGSKAMYVIGCAMGISGCIWIHFSCDSCDSFKFTEIFVVAGLLGSGASIMLISSISLTSDLINADTGTGAFVFGGMSFTDKLSNGAATAIIQKYSPHSKMACAQFFKDVLFYVSGGSAILGTIFLLTLLPFKIGERRRDRMVNAYRRTDPRASPVNEDPDERTALLT